MAEWLTDQPEHDVGPVATRTGAISFAEAAANNTHRFQ